MKIILALSICISLISVSCGQNNQNSEAKTEDNNLIRITSVQFRDEKMAFGQPERKVFTDVVRCNGSIISRPSGTARISSSVAGHVSKIYCSTGQSVHSGQALFELSGNEFIELQKELAESASRFKKISSEYNRIKALYGDKVGSEKDVIAAESEFNSSLAGYSALKLKIKNIGLDPAKIENGDFYGSFSVRSPLRGHVSEINVSLGQYTDPQAIMAIVFDDSQLQLRVAVFEKDLPGMKPGQKIKFRSSENSSFCSATLSTIGQSVDPETRSIICLADIDDLTKRTFVNNGYAEAMIIIRTDTINAVPEEAVLRSGGADYLLTLSQQKDSIYFLNKIKIKAGRSEDGYREITDPPALSQILTKGTYNIVLE
jgi:membrane fusion protein, heavy metal efflux system